MLSTPSSLNLTKVDGYSNAGLPGATFKFTELEEVSSNGARHNYKVKQGGKSETLTPSQEDGRIVLPNWGYGGAYLLEETQAPEGYELSTKKWVVVLYAADGNNSAFAYAYEAKDAAASDNYKYYITDYSDSPSRDGAGTKIANYPTVELTKVDLKTVEISTASDGSGKITYDITQDTVKLSGVGFKLSRKISSGRAARLSLIR